MRVGDYGGEPDVAKAFKVVRVVAGEWGGVDRDAEVGEDLDEPWQFVVDPLMARQVEFAKADRDDGVPFLRQHDDGDARGL